MSSVTFSPDIARKNLIEIASVVLVPWRPYSRRYACSGPQTSRLQTTDPGNAHHARANDAWLETTRSGSAQWIPMHDKTSSWVH